MIPGRKHLVMEEGLQSAWLYETLSPHVDELVVAGITQSRGPKSDKRDAYALAEKLRVGNLEKHVFKAPRQFSRLREFSRAHMTLVSDVVRTSRSETHEYDECQPGSAECCEMDGSTARECAPHDYPCQRNDRTKGSPGFDVGNQNIRGNAQH
ncbi:MAG: transposase [Deltaproteobacteria bacterium]|nr:transposase [Deltaproteobacteria bacterium]